MADDRFPVVSLAPGKSWHDVVNDPEKQREFAEFCASVPQLPDDELWALMHLSPIDREFYLYGAEPEDNGPATGEWRDAMERFRARLKEQRP